MSCHGVLCPRRFCLRAMLCLRALLTCSARSAIARTVPVAVSELELLFFANHIAPNLARIFASTSDTCQIMYRREPREPRARHHDVRRALLGRTRLRRRPYRDIWRRHDAASERCLDARLSTSLKSCIEALLVACVWALLAVYAHCSSNSSGK